MATINSVRPSGANGAGSTTSRFNAYGVLVTPDEKLVFASAKDKPKGATLCANSGGPGAKTGLNLADGKPRRLTPRECARMQGFPESFVPHATPSQARKQFGNSVAVPVVSAVAEAAAKFF